MREAHARFFLRLKLAGTVVEGETTVCDAHARFFSMVEACMHRVTRISERFYSARFHWHSSITNLNSSRKVAPTLATYERARLLQPTIEGARKLYRNQMHTMII